MPHISIDNSSCIRCKKCIKVCPALIFEWDETKKEVALTKSTNCIVCGHCAAVCPTASVKHQNFPPEKVHRIDHQNLPNSEKMMLLCKSRRSSRVFTKDDIEITLLQQIAEAAHRAPTASNQQEVAFTLVTNKEKLKEIIDFTVDTFEQMIKPLQHPLLKPILKRTKPQFYRYIPLVKRMKKEVEAGNDPILRKATALMFIHTPANAKMGIEDANLAYQNGSLMAESLGVGQFYTGFVLMAATKAPGKLEKILGIKGRIRAGMAMGIPQFRFQNYIDKKEIDINFI